MTEYFTIIGFGPLGVPTSDTDASPNSHRSVRSYKTENATRLAIKLGFNNNYPNLTHRILHTIISPHGDVTTKWIDL